MLHQVIDGGLTKERIARAATVLNAMNERVMRVYPERLWNKRDGCLKIGNLLEADPVFSEMLCASSVLTHIEWMIEKPFLASACQASTLYAFPKGRWDWHVDHPAAEGKPLPPVAISAIWALTDFNVGATAIIETREIPKVKTQPHADATIVRPKAGQVLIYPSDTWHSPVPFDIGTPRFAVLINYVKPWVIPMEDMDVQIQRMPKSTPQSVIDMMGKGRFQSQRHSTGTNRGIAQKWYFPWAYRLYCRWIG